MTVLRTVAEIGIGVLFGVGAVFHVVYTLRHGGEFYGSFADGAWLAPARWVINRVVLPNATVVTVLLILFQATVAVLIVTRGELVAGALWAGAVFAGLAALASSPGGTVGNVVLAAVQIILAVSP
jgi:hypothetical protein